MASWDLTIMGAGIFGLAAAYDAARRGARVLVLDKRAPGAGSSGGLVGALAPHVPENWNAKKAFQLQALTLAPLFWAGVQATGGVDPGYARTGRIQPVPEDKLDLARARAAGAGALWQGAGVWQVLAVDQAPGLPVVSPSGFIVHDTLSARLHPRRAVAALVAAVQALGGEIGQGAQPTGKGPVIWATGYEGLADLGMDLGRHMGGGIKGQAVLLEHGAPDAPQLFVDGLHIVPHSDGTVAIGSTSERDFDDPQATDNHCDGLLARAIAACPDLAGAPVLERWAGVRPRANSRAPLMGAWPGRPGQFVFNGGFKIGFAMAPALASIMVDLVLTGHDSVPDGFGFPDLG